LSRHRKVRLSRPKVKLSRPDIKLSRSKAVVIAAAGALSVATAASATAATWSQAPQGQAARTPHLTVTAQLARPVAEAAWAITGPAFRLEEPPIDIGGCCVA